MRIEIAPGVFTEVADRKTPPTKESEKPKKPEKDLTPEEQMVADAKSALRKLNKVKTTSTCSVCGRPESRDHAAINVAGQAHKYCKENGTLQKLALIDKSLNTATIDLAQRNQWNAQVVWMREKLKQARAEHDKFALDQVVEDGVPKGRLDWIMEGAKLAAKMIIDHRINMQDPGGIKLLLEKMAIAAALKNQQ